MREDRVQIVIIVSFFFNDTATTEIYTLSLHDALPILNTGGGSATSTPRRTWSRHNHSRPRLTSCRRATSTKRAPGRDRKSTRLNSSHANISYAVFCLKKKQHKHTTCSTATRQQAVTST